MDLGIFGATGRLGRMIGEEAWGRTDIRIKAALGRSSVGMDYGSFLGKEALGVEIRSEFEGVGVGVFIDVSLPFGVEERLKCGRPMVIGTTGFSEEEMGMVREAAERVPIFYASNFSVGMAALKGLAESLTGVFSGGMRIVETHHAGKKDAPSGSALKLAEAMHGVDVPIESVRFGDVVGKHEVIVELGEERIVIMHEALSRRVFARGALEAAFFLMDKPAGLYGMDELLAQKKEAGASWRNYGTCQS